MTQGVAGNLGDGYLWTTDPATGDIIGQTRLTHTTNNTGVTTAHDGGHPENNLDDVDTVEQALVDAQFFTLVTDLDW